MASPRPKKSSKPPSSKSVKPQGKDQTTAPVLSPQEKHSQAQAEADHWKQVAADPELSAPASAFALNLARSAQAEADLRLKGLQAPQDPNSDQYLAKMLGMGNPLPNQPTSSTTPTSDLSTGPATSGSTT